MIHNLSSAIISEDYRRLGNCRYGLDRELGFVKMPPDGFGNFARHDGGE